MDNFILANALINPNVDTNSILISKALAKKLDLKNEENIIFYVGQTKKILKVKIASTGKDVLSFSLANIVFKKMYLKSSQKYSIRSNDNEVHIGPVVGIMADFFNDTKRPFGGQTHFIKQLLISGKAIGQICFAFSPYSVDIAKGIIIGYTYGRRGWIKSAFPIPDVIYPRERAYSRTKLQMRKRLESLGVTLLNPTLVGKWETHKLLMENQQLHKFLPETRLVTSFNEVGQMLKKYDGIYLKPVAGSQGKNIINVTKKKASLIYEFKYMNEERLVKGSAGNLNNLKAYLRKVMGNRSYIVQKEIKLIKSEGNIVDVRVLVQKDNTGEWDITGIACRIGSNGSITSNISSGGSGKKIEEILTQHIALEGDRRRIMDDIYYLSIEATKTIEKNIGQSGEMGIDLGIDTSGNVWFIEANIRPARQVFNLIGEPDTRLKSVERPMLYARYLAGF